MEMNNWWIFMNSNEIHGIYWEYRIQNDICECTFGFGQIHLMCDNNISLFWTNTFGFERNTYVNVFVTSVCDNR